MKGTGETPMKRRLLPLLFGLLVLAPSYALMRRS